MIKNQKQAGVTRKKLDELKKAKVELESQKDKMEPTRYELALDSLDGLIDELQDELNLYDSLMQGNFSCDHKSFQDFPKVLIAARLAQNLSHEELGKLLGLKGQQIQRYEATDYETASWVRMAEIALALNLESYLKCWIKGKQDNEMLFTCLGKTDEQIEEANKKIKSMGLFAFAN